MLVAAQPSDTVSDNPKPCLGARLILNPAPRWELWALSQAVGAQGVHSKAATEKSPPVKALVAAVLNDTMSDNLKQSWWGGGA